MLRKCPFCGGDVNVRSMSGGYKVACQTRGCLGKSVTKKFETEDEAVKAWNNRPDEVVGFFKDNLVVIVNGQPILQSGVDIVKTQKDWGEPIRPILVK